ncbi:MAG: acyl carrier protein [Gammaproteobacteria bacterium]|nr:MAG: acyl carrier protein [Gammaproteobacteria bacterium]
MDRNTILEHLTTVLVRDFEVPAEAITPEANLYADLDLDSIDAVDLIVQVQDLIDKKIQPDEFKAARTVDDILTIISKHTQG